jgi:hypothetical protein
MVKVGVGVGRMLVDRENVSALAVGLGLPMLGEFHVWI